MTPGLSCSPLHVQGGQTALYIATRKGHDQIMKLFLGRKANVNHQTKVRRLMLVCVCSFMRSDFFNDKNACITLNKVISDVPSNRLGYKHQDIIIKLVSVLDQVCAQDD